MVIQLNWAKRENVATASATLINAATGTTNGEWVNVDGLGPYSIHVSGVEAGDVVRVHGSNKITAPANGDAEAQIGSDITQTAQKIRQYTSPLTWFKVSIPTHASGTITVTFKLRSKA